MSKPNRKRCDSKYTDEEMEKIFLAELAAAKIKCAKISIKMACSVYTQGGESINVPSGSGPAIALPGQIPGGSGGAAIAVPLPGQVPGGSAGPAASAVPLPGQAPGGSGGPAAAIPLPGQFPGGSGVYPTYPYPGQNPSFPGVPEGSHEDSSE